MSRVEIMQSLTMSSFYETGNSMRSVTPTSLAKEFDMILENDSVHKSLSLYKERRFTKLGYTAGAIVDCLPQFEKLLEQTHHNSMLVQACTLYLESDYIIASLKALANFTCNVTMPYLNFVERSDQNDLVSTMKTLYEDLGNGKMDKLKHYQVPWTHVNMNAQKTVSDLDHHLLRMQQMELKCNVPASIGKTMKYHELPKSTN